MTPIGLEAIVYPGIVTMLAAIQLTLFAKWVGKCRLQHKIPYPQMAGNPAFERTVRAQQNSLEFFPVFMASLWMSSLFCHQVASAVTGLVYIYSRHMYFQGYTQSVKERLPGFKLGVKCLLLLAAMSMCGFVTTLLRMHLAIDVGPVLRSLLFP